jgi:hypothetical protein
MADPICVVIPSWPHGSMEKTSQTDWRRERSLLEAGSLIGDGFPRQLIQAEVGLWFWPGKNFQGSQQCKDNIQAVIGETKRALLCCVAGWGWA